MGIFSKIAFFGPLGIFAIFLITYPRYWFSLLVEKVMLRFGYESNITDYIIYSTLGFFIQLLIVSVILT